ncbi:MAG TPA: RsmE family RNA methyltransferase [bacterium]|nr:RsmE family RNA methyltransferase [bacterium]
MHQLFVDLVPEPGQRLALEGDERHYLGRALRARPGERFRLADPDGRAAVAVLESFQGDTAWLLVEAESADPADPFQPHLLLCPPKGDALDSALEQAVQLGVASVQLLRSERTLANLDGAPLQPAKLERRLREACRQCLRAQVPVLKPWQPLAAALAEPREGSKIFLSERGGISLKAALPPVGSKVHLLIGPEGGFTAQELSIGMAAGWQAVSLGPRALKVPTAVAVTLGGLQVLAEAVMEHGADLA